MAINFPILTSADSERRKRMQILGCPKTISWTLIAPHERQALRNHDQTLKRLAERGGLSACEAVAVLENRDWRQMTDEDAVARLNQLVREADHGC